MSTKEKERHKKRSFESQRFICPLEWFILNRRFFRLFINGIVHLLVISELMTRLEPQFPQSTYTLTRGDAVLWVMLDPA